MNDCKQTTEMIMLARGELDGDQARMVESHFAACGTCRAAIEELAAAGRLFGDVPEVAEERWEGLWRRLQQHMDERGLPRGRWGPLVRGFAVTAAAAAILLAAYVFMPAPRQPEERRDAGRFELVSFEVSSPEYDIAIMTTSGDEIPVIWLERL